MFTSLRSRLWLSYAFVIVIALSVVIVVLLLFLVRNPVLYRETTRRLRVTQSQLAESESILNSPEAIQRIAEANDTRVLIFDLMRNLIFDSSSDIPGLSFPRKNALGRTSQFTADADGGLWLQSTSRLPNGNVLVVAAPRPSVRFLNIFADELCFPFFREV